MVTTIPKMKSTPTMSLVGVLTIIDMALQMMKNSMKRSPTGRMKRPMRNAPGALLECTSRLGGSMDIHIEVDHKRRLWIGGNTLSPIAGLYSDGQSSTMMNSLHTARNRIGIRVVSKHERTQTSPKRDNAPNARPRSRYNQYEGNK